MFLAPGNFENSIKLLNPMRFQVHQNGQNRKSEAKEALRPLFNATIKGFSSDGDLQHEFKIGVRYRCCHRLSIGLGPCF